MYVKQFTGTVEDLQRELDRIGDGRGTRYEEMAMAGDPRQFCEILFVSDTHVANTYMIGYRSVYVQNVIVNSNQVSARVLALAQEGKLIRGVNQVNNQGSQGSNPDDVIILYSDDRIGDRS